MRNQQEKEELLEGGNVTNVYRSGATVRRELKPESTKIHTLLKHLDRKGYKNAPSFQGIDEQGREILSFIEGEAGNYPLKNSCGQMKLWKKSQECSAAIMML